MGYVRYMATTVQCSASKECYTFGEQITPIACINQPYRNNITITGCVFTLLNLFQTDSNYEENSALKSCTLA